MYRFHRKLTKRLYVLSFAIGLLLCETGLLVHEVEHHLSQAQETACFLCDAAHQFGNAILAHSPVFIPSVVNEIRISRNTGRNSQRLSVSYNSRAPPFNSSV